MLPIFGHYGKTPRLRAVSMACSVLLLVLLLLCSESHAAPVIELHEDMTKIDLSPFVDILEDSEGKLSIDDVIRPLHSSRFRPSGQKNLNLGVSQSAFWLRFRLMQKGKGRDGDRWIIDLGRPYLTDLKAYMIGQEEGMIPIELHPKRIRGLSPYFTISNDIGKTSTIYMRIRHDGTLALPLRIYAENSFLSHIIMSFLVMGIPYGIFIAMMLSNLFLYITLRDRSHIAYLLYLTPLVLYLIIFDGIFQAIPILRWLGDGRTCYIMLGLSATGAGLFSRIFLLAKKYSPASDRILMAYSLAGAIGILLSMILPTMALNYYYVTLGILSPFVITSSTIACYRRGFRPINLFITGWGTTALGAFIYALTYIGVLPYTSLNINSLEIGATIEAVLLSLALGRRIKILDGETQTRRLNELHYKKLAVMDGLTGLYNAEHFRSETRSLIQKADREHRPLSLLMLDLDNFKEWNDTGGHLEGDRVLLQMAEILRSIIGEGDIACRYGGDEFAVALAGRDEEESLKVANTIMKRLHQLRERFEERGRHPATVSIGVAEHVEGENYETLFYRADVAMYRSKELGKNRTTSARQKFPSNIAIM